MGCSTTSILHYRLGSWSYSSLIIVPVIPDVVGGLVLLCGTISRWPPDKASSSYSPPHPSASHHGSIIASKHRLGSPVSQDPRTSSSQSLRSATSGTDERRTLLIVYIHGFYGNDQSFRSFPYHVHSHLKSSLADSHVLHSKIYPRYKTYRSIELARDNFSQWLAPHESPTTDVVLVGHSMGGILAADVVLLVCMTISGILVTYSLTY